MIRIDAKGIPDVQAWLKKLASEVRTIAGKAVAEYLVGDETHGLKHEPYYIYVNRYAGFPNLSYVTKSGTVVPGYKSAKQHRYVMAAIARGEIKPGQDNRTHTLSDGWSYKAQGSNYVIKNPTPYAKYVIGGQQTRMHKLIGWRFFNETVKDNLAGAFRAARAAVKKWTAEHRRR